MWRGLSFAIISPGSIGRSCSSDALSALNSGPAAVKDLENALTEVMRAFRAGRSSYFASVFRPRIDRHPVRGDQG